MSARRGRMRGNKESKSEDFELNIASIIDCFTVLITYLLVSASFISLGVIDVSVATPGPVDTAQQEDPSVSLTIEVAQDKSLQVNLSGKEKKTVSIPSKNDSWDFEGLEATIRPIKDKWTDLKVAVIAAQPSVEYDQVVKVVSTARKVVPTVFLGDQLVE